jgi:hypothetical protein
MSKTKLLLFVFVALLFSVSALPAFAIDGQVLINQSTVEATGGFPYKITESGSYKLSGNLVVGPGLADGIDISANNVVLDLNGFTITGSPFMNSSYTESGINGTSENITIENGSVSGFTIDVNLAGAGGLVEEVHASNFVNEGFGVNAGIVRRCTIIASISVSTSGATANAGTGINVTGSVVEDNLVTMQATSNNGDTKGVGVYAKSGSTVIHNVVTMVESGPTYSMIGIECDKTIVLGNAVAVGAYAVALLPDTDVLYGSNSLYSDEFPVYAIGSGNTSQSNNNCGGTVC